MLQNSRNHVEPDGAKPLDIRNTCRICLMDESHCGLFPMNFKLKQILMHMFSINIGEKILWKICVSCLTGIEQAAKYKVLAIESDIKIRNFLESNALVPPNTSKINVRHSSELISEQADSIPQNGQHFDMLPEEADITPEMPLCEQQLEVKREPIDLDSESSTFNETGVYGSESEPYLSPRSALIQETSGFWSSGTNQYQYPELIGMNASDHTTDFDNDSKWSSRALVDSGSDINVKNTKPATRVFAPRFENGAWICCGRVFKPKKSFYYHKTKVHPETRQLKTYTCMNCNIRFEGGKALYQHNQTVHGGKPLSNVCNVCNKDCAGRSSLRKHKVRHHPELFVK